MLLLVKLLKLLLNFSPVTACSRVCSNCAYQFLFILFEHNNPRLQSCWQNFAKQNEER